MKIYAEWTLYGEFYNEFFISHEDFCRATFNPDCIILVVKNVGGLAK